MADQRRLVFRNRPLPALQHFHAVGARARRLELRHIRDGRRRDVFQRLPREEALVAGDHHVRKSQQSRKDVVPDNRA